MPFESHQFFYIYLEDIQVQLLYSKRKKLITLMEDDFFYDNFKN